VIDENIFAEESGTAGSIKNILFPTVPMPDHN